LIEDKFQKRSFLGKRYRYPVQIREDLYEPLVKFILNHRKEKKVAFTKFNSEHIAYFKVLIDKPDTINLTLA